jgi:hypothetical protein
MFYKEFVKTVDPELIKRSRQLSFLIGLNTFSNIYSDDESGDEEFSLKVSGKMFPFLKFMEETQWEILYFLETGKDVPEYVLNFLDID